MKKEKEKSGKGGGGGGEQEWPSDTFTKVALSPLLFRRKEVDIYSFKKPLFLSISGDQRKKKEKGRKSFCQSLPPSLLLSLLPLPSEVERLSVKIRSAGPQEQQHFIKKKRRKEESGGE